MANPARAGRHGGARAEANWRALCRLSSPSLAGVLARMEEIGLVKRERLAHDQRRVLVSLSSRSRSLAARMAPQIDAIYADIEAELGP